MTTDEVTTTPASRCSPILCLLAVFVVLLTTALICITTLHTHQLSRNQRMCTTASCSLTAAKLLRNMNQSASPCADFTTYVCGGYQKRVAVGPTDQGVRQLFRDKLQRVVDLLHESLFFHQVQKSSRSSFLQYSWKVQAARFYRSCYSSHQDSLQKRTDLLKEEFQRQLRAVFLTAEEFYLYPPLVASGTAGLKSWSKEKSLEKLLAQFSAHDLSLAIDLVPRMDDSRPGACKGAEAAALTFVPASWANSKSSQIHAMDAKMAFSLLNISTSVSRITTLHQQLDDYYKLEDYSEELMNYSEVSEFFSSLFGNEGAWNRFLSTLTEAKLVDIEVVNKKLICVVMKQNIVKAVQLLRKQDAETVLGYGIVNAIMRLSPMLPRVEQFINSESIRSELTVEYRYTSDLTPAQNCVGFLTKLAEFIPGRIYTDETPKSGNSFDEIVKKIKRTYLEIIKNSQYSEGVKSTALDVVESTNYAEVQEDKFMNELYSSIEMGSNYIENLVHLLKYPKRRFIAELMQRTTIRRTIDRFSRFYDNRNGAVLTAYLRHENEEFTGFLVAHDLTWRILTMVNFYSDAADQRRYEQSSAKLTQWMQKYQFNDSNSIQNSIADITAANVAITAFMETGEQKPILPGLDAASAQQLKFVSLAQQLCYKAVPKIYGDSRFGTPNIRLNSIAQVPNFASTFACKDSNMISLW